MRETLRFEPGLLRPEPDLVLKGRDMPEKLEPRHEALLAEAMDILGRVIEPVGVLQEISAEDFSDVFEGEGRNEAPNPVERIYPRASSLALFAATLGPAVSRRTEELFERHDYALGYMLDAAASAAADRCAELLQEKAVSLFDEDSALRYSPGYCGWHLSGQARLFEALEPGDIGISLRPGFLMEPLKSVSGVLLCGAAQIHAVEEGFEFCGRCSHQGCRVRTASVKG